MESTFKILISSLFLFGTIQYELIDDGLYVQIQRVPLPQNYMQTQNLSTALHPLIIEPAWDFSDSPKHNRYIQQMGRIFHIASYYFQKVIRVQTIPRNQTKLKKRPQNLKLPYNYTKTIQVSQKFQQQGFDTQLIDLIIFIKMIDQFYFLQVDGKKYDSSNQFMSGVLQVQRRPIYGLMVVQLKSEYLGQNDNLMQPKLYVFHHRVQKTVHSIMHILGFSVQYFLPDSLFRRDNYTIIDPNYKTIYFENASSVQNKNQSEIITMKKGFFVFKSQQLRKVAFEIFNCESRNIKIEDMGVALQTIIVNETQNGQLFSFQMPLPHFSNRFSLQEELMQVNDDDRLFDRTQYRQNLKISTLSLSFLRDTGFYEEIIIDESTTDYYAKDKQTKSRKRIAFYNQKFDSCTFERMNLTIEEQYCRKDVVQYGCDQYGQMVKSSKLQELISTQTVIKNEKQYNKCRQVVTICQSYDLSKPRCLQQVIKLNQGYIQKIQKDRPTDDTQCYSVQCLVAEDQYVLKVIIGGQNYKICTKNQSYAHLHESLILRCPQDKEIFCNVKLCSNMCSYQGLCVRGQCIIPKSKLDWQKLLSLSSINNKSEYCYQSKLPIQNSQCQRGCLLCKCRQIVNLCYFAEQFYSLDRLIVNNFSSGTSLELYFPIMMGYNCKYGQYKILFNYTGKFFDSINVNEPLCYMCHQEFYLLPYKNNSLCFRCESKTCTSCLEEFHFGVQCTNCQQGYFINEQKECEPCLGLNNCLNCRKNFNQKLQCLKCLSGYHLTSIIPFQANQYRDRIQNACIRCMPSCAACDQNNIGSCRQCFEGYFMKNDTEKMRSNCQKCVQNCKICQNERQCLQCFPSYILKNSQQMHKCVLPCSEQCFSCIQNQPNKCLSCFDDYKFDGQSNKCIPALVCNKDGNCFKCPKKYGLSVIQQNKIQCAICGIRYCISCSPQFFYCTQCQNGYFVYEKDFDCHKCPNQCKTCRSRQFCTLCVQGYTKTKNMDGTIFQNKCIKCANNCLTCLASPHQCTSCQKNYFQVGLMCLQNKNQINITFTVKGYQKNMLSKVYTQLFDKILQYLQLNNQLECNLLELQQNGTKIKVHVGSNKDSIVGIAQNYLLRLGDTFQINSPVGQVVIMSKLYSSNVPRKCYLIIYTKFKLQRMGDIMINQQLLSIDNLYLEGPKDENQNCSGFIIIQKNENSLSPQILGILITLSVVIILTVLVVVRFCCFQPRRNPIVQQQPHNQQILDDGEN